MAFPTIPGRSHHIRPEWRLAVATLATHLVVVFGSALSAAELGETRVATWKDDRRAPLVLMFDDSMPSHVKTVLPELQKRKLTGTFYINPGSGHYQAHKAAWENDFPAAGMVLANHTFTHKGARDVANCEEEIIKCNDVLDAIASAAGGHKPGLISFGRPGVPKGAWNVTDDELAQLLAKHRLILRPNVLFAQIHLKDAPAMVARVERALASGKPESVAFHGVGGEWLSIDVPAFLTFLDFVDKNRDRLWVTDPISIHKYEKEREAAKVEVKETSAKQICIVLSSQADAAVYDEPLTLVTQVPGEWKNVTVSQGKRMATLAATNGQVQYDASPGDEAIILQPAP